MKKCVVVLAVGAALLASSFTSGAAAVPAPELRKACSAYAEEHFHDVTAHLPDGTKCIGKGEHCSHAPAFARAYRQYGFVCKANGRLQEIRPVPAARTATSPRPGPTGLVDPLRIREARRRNRTGNLPMSRSVAASFGHSRFPCQSALSVKFRSRSICGFSRTGCRLFVASECYRGFDSRGLAQLCYAACLFPKRPGQLLARSHWALGRRA